VVDSDWGYAWRIVDRGGTELMEGLDITERQTCGSLQRVVMFHGALPAADRQRSAQQSATAAHEDRGRRQLAVDTCENVGSPDPLQSTATPTRAPPCARRSAVASRLGTPLARASSSLGREVPVVRDESGGDARRRVCW
jgi:hypothetical protein